MTTPDERLLEVATIYLKQLRDLFRSRGVKVSAAGTFAELVIAFCWKQEDHADAILKLGKHRDVQLVARSMIEGLCQLKWAANDPDARAERWRLYAWVHDWRLLRRDDRAGRAVPVLTRQRIEEGIATHGHLFETRKAAERRRQGKPVADPYVRHWSGQTIAEICAEVKGQRLHEWPYADFSDWHHWSPGGVVRAFKADGRKISFPPPTPRDVLPSCVVAFQCLYETMEVANNTLHLGLESELETMLVGFQRDLKPVPAATQSENSS